MLLHPAITAIAERRATIDKALRAGSLSDGTSLLENYAYVYRDGPTPTLAMGRSGAADLSSVDDDEGIIYFVVTVLQEDRDGDVVVPKGRQGENYARNPTWFFGHQEWEIPVGTSWTKDFTRVMVQVEENRIRQGCRFDRADPDADYLYGKVKRGMINATSIAFVPIEAYRRDDVEKAQTHEDRRGPARGWLFKTWDHTETSLVGVGSNPGAVRDDLDREKSFMSPRLQKAMRPYAAVAKGCWNGWCPCPPCETKGVAKAALKPLYHVGDTVQNTYAGSGTPTWVPARIVEVSPGTSPGKQPANDPFRKVKPGTATRYRLEINGKNYWVDEDAVEKSAKSVRKYITHDGDKWTVHAESGKVLGTHDSKADAERQLRAVEANKHKAVTTKKFDTPEEFTSEVWRRANKTEKPYVRTLSSAQIQRIVDATDRYTLGSLERGEFASGGRYTISRYSGGFMVIDTSAQKSAKSVRKANYAEIYQEEVDGPWYVVNPDDWEDVPEAKGKVFPSKEEAVRFAIKNGYTPIIKSVKPIRKGEPRTGGWTIDDYRKQARSITAALGVHMAKKQVVKVVTPIGPFKIMQASPKIANQWNEINSGYTDLAQAKYNAQRSADSGSGLNTRVVDSKGQLVAAFRAKSFGKTCCGSCARGRPCAKHAKAASSNESIQTPYGLEWRARGGGSGRKWFSTEQEREKFADKLAEKYGGYDVLDLRWADPQKSWRKKALSTTSGTAGGYATEATDGPTVTPGVEVCAACDGTHNCQTCRGHGEIDGAVCDECGGSGECPVCMGMTAMKGIKKMVEEVFVIEYPSPGGVRFWDGKKWVKELTSAVRYSSRGEAQSTLQAVGANGAKVTPVKVKSLKGQPMKNTKTTKKRAPVKANCAVRKDVEEDATHEPEEKELTNEGNPEETENTEPTPPHSAQVLAALHHTMTKAGEYLDGELAKMEPEAKPFFEKHKDEINNHLEAYKGEMESRHPDHDIEEMSKGLETDGADNGEFEPGEAGLVDAGDVPEEAEEAEAYAGEETPEEEALEEEGKDLEGDAVHGKGMDDDTAPDTEEILERYQTPKGWRVRRCLVRTTKDGRKYLVRQKGFEIIPDGDEWGIWDTVANQFRSVGGVSSWPTESAAKVALRKLTGKSLKKSLTDEGNPAELKDLEEDATHKGAGDEPFDPQPAAVTDMQLGVIKDAAEHFDAMTDDGSIPKYHHAGFHHHSKALHGLHKELSEPAEEEKDLTDEGHVEDDAGAGSPLSNQGNPAELKSVAKAFKVGDQVQILDGSYKGRAGEILRISGENIEVDVQGLNGTWMYEAEQLAKKQAKNSVAKSADKMLAESIENLAKGSGVIAKRFNTLMGNGAAKPVAKK